MLCDAPRRAHASDAITAALLRAVVDGEPGPRLDIVLLNAGASATNINILQGDQSVFTRDIQMGGNVYNEELQKRLGLNGEDAETVKLGGEVLEQPQLRRLLADQPLPHEIP